MSRRHDPYNYCPRSELHWSDYALVGALVVIIVLLALS